ncbi:D-isomer specific 2-hydroxyacid dehydrogenase, catalytic domain [Flavobacterium caeni]|uniref:D-isomer specific 2-hydroxyacid dehydrogenase, catalytic domain n=1 Tax=Flavobacterium caeni TaxID=490189 RepID=A0A1G5E7K4_9FLAO|nr:D-isomer specific 2-hydroxyacid dehydrogenase, catalytic domain [Flavobacterium caeni]
MTPQIKILHLDTNHPLLLEQLQQAGFTNDEDYTSGKEQIEAKIQNYHGIVIRSRFKIDKAFLDQATNLQFIARVGAGLESIDVEHAESRNITLIAAPEGNRNAVGEHTLAMLLALFNKTNTADAQIRQGHWHREGNRGHELDGKTVGIIGYGNMGKSFAKKLLGFDVKVLCYDILDNVGDANAQQVSLETLQQQSDVLSLHIPWTPETDKMVDTNFINAFSKPFWLLNTSRGKNVVTADLASALESGKILGAGLDVLEYEKSSFEHLFHDGDIPAAFQYLLQSDKVVLSPHIAGWTFESHQRLAQVIVDKIKAKYFGATGPEPVEKRVTGIGGFFFKSQNPTALKDWYGQHLGLNVDQWGCTFWWKDAQGNDCSTQWSPFADDTKYFDPSEKQFMQNFRVHDLDGLLDKLRAAGVTLVGTPEAYDYGKFAWILDPEGNKIELWEPIDSAFQ